MTTDFFTSTASPGRAGRKWARHAALVSLVASLMLADVAGGQVDGSPEVVRTESYEIHLSPVGGLPLVWDILVPAPEADGFERVGLVDAELLGPGLPRPLEVLLPEAGELNQVAHQVERFDDGGDVVVRFTSPPTSTGLRWIRTYRIPTSGFETRLGLTLINDGGEPLRLDPGLRLGPGLDVEQRQSAGLGDSLYSYVRPVYKLGDDVESPSLSAEEPTQDWASSNRGAGESPEIAWGGIHNRYFLAALAPDREPGERFVSGKGWISERLPMDGPDEQAAHPTVDLLGASLSLAPGETIELSHTFFFGPKERRVLRASRSELTDILFPGLWGWMRWLCFILTSMLSGFHGVLHSWGLSILALAVAIRLLTFPVAQAGLKQQAAMAADQARLKPYITEINEKYKDSGQRSEAMLRLYKEHGINPFAAFKGCFWVILQLPIFISLFNIIGQAYELRGAGFLWISDLSEPDRLFPLGVDLPFLGSYFNILPILMAGTQVVVTYLSLPPETDPAEGAKQKKFMIAMAVFFLFLFYSFPAGLVLYWTTANLGQFVQQRLVTWYGARAAAKA